MIKNYKNYLKENLDYSDIDPYGEEIWDDDELSPILNIAKKQGIPYVEITRLFCYHKKLNSLEGIEKLINLEVLVCFDNTLKVRQLIHRQLCILRNVE
jgi:hypothetical protein